MKKVPLIFIPGLFGSMSDVIIPGTGSWHFGIAGILYGPFVKMLETLGYTLGKNLFIAFYDWRQEMDFIVEEYLLALIQKAKEITGNDEVNLISHSLGGLVARTYIQSDYYQDDVDKVIQISTPNAGSAPNFSYWTGGELPDQQDLSFNFVRAYMDIYLEILKLQSPLNPIPTIHEKFPSLGQIIPAKAYGDYLYYKEDERWTLKDPSKNKTQNGFLDKLNEESSIISQRNIQLFMIAGRGEATVEYLQIEPYLWGDKWVDGRVVDFASSAEGDGNALIKSVFCIDGEKYIIDGATHITILYKSRPIIKKALSSS